MKILSDALASQEQLLRIEHIEIASGRGKGNEILQVWNGMLYFEVNVSRGFDIGACYFKGLPVSWLSPCGHVSPNSYDPTGDAWNKGFEGGLLTTCGLEHAGQVEENYGLHGRISYIEAEIEEKRITEKEIILSAILREVKVGGRYYVLRRTITSPLFQNKICIRDIIENKGFSLSPLMLLYHINWGPLFLGSDANFSGLQGSWEFIRGTDTSTRTKKFPDLAEGTFEVISCADIENTDNQVNLQISTKIIQAEVVYDAQQLPYLTQWRFRGNGANVLSWEPGNVSTRGQRYHKETGSLTYLEPKESKEFSLTFQFT